MTFGSQRIVINFMMNGNKEGDDIKTLSSFDWLVEYGRRSSSIWGSSETLQVAMDDSDEDDGMARMMI